MLWQIKLKYLIEYYLFRKRFPEVKDLKKIGKYPLKTYSGGGLVYDDVLEYRVWVHPEIGDDVCYSFAKFKDALNFSFRGDAEQPIMLISQDEYYDTKDGVNYHLVRKPRISEWAVDWLKYKNEQKVLQQLKQKIGT